MTTIASNPVDELRQEHTNQQNSITSPFYTVNRIPIFQNKVYPTVKEAMQSETSSVALDVDPNSGIIRNALFDDTLMNYDEHYQNEQNYSPFFQQYVDDVAATLEAFIEHDKTLNIVEIGCGKGYFLELLRTKGYRVTGYDPTYEGTAEYIVKDYFGANTIIESGDLLVLRHTMEHIPSPYSFLKMVAKANGNTGKLFIEVPTFDWILENTAFWDIFYEHCNYFTEASFANLFTKAQTGRLFNGQYMYLYADLADLKPDIELPAAVQNEKISSFGQRLEAWADWLRQHQHEGIAVWGAGAKGSTFVNRLDPTQEFVRCVVDISPRKYGKYIAATAHPILSPEAFRQHNDIQHILVMNPNYLAEIEAQFEPGRYHILPLQ